MLVERRATIGRAGCIDMSGPLTQAAVAVGGRALYTENS